MSEKLRAASERFLEAWLFAESNHGCYYSCGDPHDPRCAYWAGLPCNCGRTELEAAASELMDELKEKGHE
jgi:hypothetical protein